MFYLIAMLRFAFLLIVCVGLALASQQGLVLQDGSSALFIDAQLNIVDLVDTQLHVRSFLAPLHDWWSADYVVENSNGLCTQLPPPLYFCVPNVPSDACL
jgi:hypothetical protein